MRGGQGQFEIMVEFMEQNTEMCRLPIGDTQARLASLQKWIKLADLLNESSNGHPKPIDKWKKCWSDFKNNTKKKVERLRNKGVGRNCELTDVEKRLLVLIGEQNLVRKRQVSGSDDDNVIPVKEEIDADPFQRMTTASAFCCTDDRTAEETQPRRSSESSIASSSSSSQRPYVKRRKRYRDNMKDVTDRYLEFEKEKEKMAHEREMTRMKQNETLISIFGKIVNVLETLAPSIQRYLDRGTNDGG